MNVIDLRGNHESGIKLYEAALRAILAQREYEIVPECIVLDDDGYISLANINLRNGAPILDLAGRDEAKFCGIPVKIRRQDEEI